MSETMTAANNKMQAFAFGDPEPVINGRGLMDYLECLRSNKWYEPPVSLEGLTRTLRAAVHHASAINAKRNILTSMFVPNPLMSRAEFDKFAFNYLVLGNAYFEERRNRLGGRLGFTSRLAKYMRRDLNLVDYWWVPSYNQEEQIPGSAVFHLMDADLDQEIYGIPQWMSVLNSTLLNESATLFRRKYYQNGSHAGFILYVSDPAQSPDDIEAIRKALKDSKGPGNFRNLFMYSPNGKKDGVQLIPVSQVAASDEFLNIKNATRDDILAAHRVPPQLMGIVPNNAAGFGDATKAAEIFYENEITPLIQRFNTFNEWAGAEIITFGPYALASVA